MNFLPKKLASLSISFLSFFCYAQQPNTIIPTPGLESGFTDPNGIAITPNGEYAYVTNRGGNSVSVNIVSIDAFGNISSATPITATQYC